jgi:hypothetical protein
MNDNSPTLDYWQDLASSSHYLTAVAIKRALEAGDYSEAEFGLSQLIDALSRSDKHAVRSHLIRLMTHIFKWKAQPEKRSASWAVTIDHAHDEIRAYQEANPSITDEKIKEMWAKCFERACKQAELEMQKKSNIDMLSWNEVFNSHLN